MLLTGREWERCRALGEKLWSEEYYESKTAVRCGSDSAGSDEEVWRCLPASARAANQVEKFHCPLFFPQPWARARHGLPNDVPEGR